jgi:multidrug efflux pump subunit AcrA (membrane-fusion protein)
MNSEKREDPMKRGLKRVLIVLIILIIIGGLGAVAYYRYEEKLQLASGFGGRFGGNTDEEVDTATPVAVYRVGRGRISDSLVLNGEILPVNEVNIFSTVPGKVKEILVDEGDRVEKEQKLLFIDRSEAGMSYAPTPIESTIGGLVKDVLVSLGDYISPQIPLMQVIDMDLVDVVVNIPERDIYRISVGQRAEIAVVSYPERLFWGRVDELSPVVDPVSRTREARIHIENINHVLKPGMFGEVRIIVRSRSNSIIIPLAAVVEKEEASQVFVVENGTVRVVEPELDIREGDMISVRSGIEEGDQIVVIGQQNVSHGDSVRITEEIQ